MDLSRGEFVRVPALDLSDDGVARFDALPLRLSHKVSTDDALGHRHRAFRRVERSKVQRSGFQGFCEREEAAVLHNELGHRVVLTGEFVERDGLTVLQALEHFMATHQLAEVDVVSFVDGGKGGSDDDADARPTFALGRSFSTGPGSFSLS